MTTTLEMWFDLRKPKWASQPTRETYAACVDMCEWGDSLGFQAITLGEHHGMDDDYLASPVQMAGIIGGRTRRLQLRMIILTPFYNPIRLAERRQRPQEVHVMRAEFNDDESADVVCNTCGRRVRLRSGEKNVTEKETIVTGNLTAIHTLASG